MKILSAALTATMVAANAGVASAVFPAHGQSVRYAIHETSPRGNNDTTLTLTGTDAAGITITAPGKAPVQFSTQRPPMDRSLGMEFHALMVADEVAAAANDGKTSAEIMLGPPGAPPATLQIARSGETVTATGSAAPPRRPGGGADEHGGPPEGGGPPNGGHPPELQIRVVETIVNGRLVRAKASVSPKDGRGPSMSWTVTRS